MIAGGTTAALRHRGRRPRGRSRPRGEADPLFVAGHSLTLVAATLAGWQVDAGLVDVVIALNVASVGVRLLYGRPERWTGTGLAVLAFGLVHGLGLSTRLQDLDLPDGGALVARVLAFNLGVELGQLTVIGALVLLWRMGSPRSESFL